MENLENSKLSKTEQDTVLELKDFYDTFLLNLIDFTTNYGYTSILEIFSIVNLISELYDDKIQIYKTLTNKSTLTYPSLEKLDISGIQTLLGSGVCRHKSAFLSDLYNRIGKESLVLIGRNENLLNFYYGNSQNKCLYDMIFISKILNKISQGAKIEDFEKQLEKRKISYQLKNIHDDYYSKIKHTPNHAIVLVGDENRYYLDPMHTSVLFRDDCNEKILKNRRGQYFFFDERKYLLHYMVLCELDKELYESVNAIMAKYITISGLESQTEEETRIELIKAKNRIYHDKNTKDFIMSYQFQIQNIKEKSLILKKIK